MSLGWAKFGGLHGALGPKCFCGLLFLPSTFKMIRITDIEGPDIVALIYSLSMVPAHVAFAPLTSEYIMRVQTFSDTTRQLGGLGGIWH